MAARRLLIVMLVLLGISILGGTLLPAQRTEDRTDTTGTEPVKQPTEPAVDKVPRGELRAYTLKVSGDRPVKIEIDVGDQLLLSVRSRKSDQVEIPRLGLIETVDRYGPAKFDLLITEPGSYPIWLVEAKRKVGRIAVARR